MFATPPLAPRDEAIETRPEIPEGRNRKLEDARGRPGVGALETGLGTPSSERAIVCQHIEKRGEPLSRSRARGWREGPS